MNEDLPIPDLAGLGSAGNHFDDLVDGGGIHSDFNLQLRQEADGILGAAIDFGVPLLAAIALDLGIDCRAARFGGFARFPIPPVRVSSSRSNFPRPT